MSSWDREAVGDFLHDTLSKDDPTGLKFLYSETLWDHQKLLAAIKFTNEEDNLENEIWSFLKNSFPLKSNMRWIFDGDLFSSTLIDHCISSKSFRCFQFLMKYHLIDWSEEMCTVSELGWKKDTRFIHEFLKHDVDFGCTWVLGANLIAAAIKGDLESVKMLLKKGVDVNLIGEEVAATTPLCFAIAYKQWKVVEYLLGVEDICVCEFEAMEVKEEFSELLGKTIFELAEDEPELAKILDQFHFDECPKQVYRRKQKRKNEELLAVRKKQKTNSISSR